MRSLPDQKLVNCLPAGKVGSPSNTLVLLALMFGRGNSGRRPYELLSPASWLNCCCKRQAENSHRIINTAKLGHRKDKPFESLIQRVSSFRTPLGQAEWVPNSEVSSFRTPLGQAEWVSYSKVSSFQGAMCTTTL
jgi:hypothetical protein